MCDKKTLNSLIVVVAAFTLAGCQGLSQVDKHKSEESVGAEPSVLWDMPGKEHDNVAPEIDAIYETKFRYTLPETAEGLRCLSQCQSNLKSCQSHENTSCLDENCICTLEFNSCVQLCGGKVEKYTECLEHCK